MVLVVSDGGPVTDGQVAAVDDRRERSTDGSVARLNVIFADDPFDPTRSTAWPCCVIGSSRSRRCC